jgi:hypothetical protein
VCGACAVCLRIAPAAAGRATDRTL